MPILIVFDCSLKTGMHITSEASVEKLHMFACKVTSLSLAYSNWTAKKNPGTIILLVDKKRTRLGLLDRTLPFSEFGMESKAAQLLTTLMCEFMSLPFKKTNFWLAPVNKENYLWEEFKKMQPLFNPLFEVKNATI